MNHTQGTASAPRRSRGGFIRIIAIGTLAAGLAAASAPRSYADPVLGIDFGGGATQAGFQSWNTGTDGAGPKTTTFTATNLTLVPTGSVGATLAGGTDAANLANDVNSLNVRTRVGAPTNSGAFTQADLMVDRVVTTGGAAGSGLFLQLTGFAPSTTFGVQVWGYDTQGSPTFGGKPGNFALYDRTNGANTSLGSFTATAGSLPTDNNTFSVTGTVTSDATGKIVLESISNIDGTGIMSGALISSVPEPSTALLALAGCTPLLARRRHRRRQ
jgi:hypothetical protein